MDLLMKDKERKNILNMLKTKYPKGTKVELVKMEDAYRKMPPGLKGIVSHIDDIGTIFINWENGSTLGVVYGEDEIKII
ncbi:MAG: hypothetical protein K0R54_768 [Clostridiaceae bacterium]|jgi:hypothetical protein|nr:hypothetical protein [Clostridiaceae bacterium]